MTKFTCWYCKEKLDDVHEKDDIEMYVVNNTNRRFHKSKSCRDKFIEKQDKAAKIKSNKKDERAELDKVYQYIKKEIMEYGNDRSLSPHAVQRLLSLRHGEFIRPGVTLNKGGYPYHIILATFKFHKQHILNSVSGKNFTSDNKKFDYIMAIVSNNINDVYNMYLHKAQQEQKIQTQKIDINTNSKVKYIKKSETNDVHSMIDNLW